MLPSEERVKTMTREDYLWCLVQMTLDEEEELARLCPACRREALEGRCPVCGAPAGEGETVVNSAFDMTRYKRMRGGSA